MKKILVTGFLPFNGRQENPSELIVNALEAPKDTDLIKLILPVEFIGAEKLLEEVVAKEKPDCLFSIGQAGNNPYLAIEQVAINLDSSLSSSGKSIIKDQAGYEPIDEKIKADGEKAYFASLPVRHLVKTLNDEGVMAGVSYSAGTYVCNHIMYVGCYLCEKYKNMISGFMHVPFLPEQLTSVVQQRGCYSMPLEEMIKGAQIVINELAKD